MPLVKSKLVAGQNDRLLFSRYEPISRIRYSGLLHRGKEPIETLEDMDQKILT